MIQKKKAWGRVVGGAIFVSLGLAVACQEPTQVVLVLRADMLCGTPVSEGYGIQEVHIYAGPSRESVAARIGGKADAIIPDCTNISTPGTLGDLVLHRDASDTAFVQIVAGLVRTTATNERKSRPADTCRFEDPNNSNCLMAMRSFKYERHAKGYIPVTLQTSCIPKWFTCPSRTTCINGECVDDFVKILPTLEPWVPPTVADAAAPDAAVADATPDVAAEAEADAPPAALFPVELALGATHTCARYDNSGVVCWGDNTEGQLGRENTIPVGNSVNSMSSLAFVDLGAGESAATISASAGRTCAVLRGSGKVACWGFNGGVPWGGQLGLEDGPLSPSRGGNPGEMGNGLLPVKLGFNKPAERLAMGHFHACASETVSDAVLCWGRSDSGELGQGDKVAHGKDPGSMASLVPLPFTLAVASDKLIALGAGASHTCAVFQGATTYVKCWGLNGTNTNGTVGVGSLGLGDLENRGDQGGEIATLPNVNLGTNITVKALSVGAFHACVIFDSPANADSVKCWGSNRYGQLGHGLPAYRGGPVNTNGSDYPEGGMPVAIQFGDLGDNLPVLNLGGRVRAIAAGDWHTCALLFDGKVKCWGRNNYGQLGYGDQSSRGKGVNDMTSLAAVDLGLDANDSVTGIYGGAGGFTANGTHTCALLASHRIKCWGRNDYGQLGIDSPGDRGIASGQMGTALPYVKLPTFAR